MEPFSAVVTTGIYCRPGCPARPDPGNVRAFGLAAAAEAAGFRPCLRCRPYRSATTGATTGGGEVPELVCRAVRLITDGALDGAPEAELGARLGVSPRHLRRLFVDHLGVTPDGLARSRRAHFARRLLDDTDLTVTEVAFASGFGSVRQLNRACRDVFRAPPSELRARRRRADRLVADGGLVVRLPSSGPLDWPAVLAFLRDHATPGVEAVSGPIYRRTIEVDGDPGVLELEPGRDCTLVARLHLPHWEGLIHLVARARRIAQLDLDVETAEGALAADPVLAPLVARRPGVRVPGCWDPFEAGVRAILGQQVSVAGATTLAGRLVAAHGTAIRGLEAFALDRLFPTPEVLAEADMTGVGLPAARAAAIRAFASAVAAGQIPLDGSLSGNELIVAVTALPGLGPWTANALALRMGETDAFPERDLGLRRVLERLAPNDDTPLGDRAERWRPWRAVATMHLWAELTGT